MIREICKIFERLQFVNICKDEWSKYLRLSLIINVVGISKLTVGEYKIKLHSMHY